MRTQTNAETNYEATTKPTAADKSGSGFKIGGWSIVVLILATLVGYIAFQHQESHGTKSTISRLSADLTKLRDERDVALARAATLKASVNKLKQRLSRSEETINGFQEKERALLDQIRSLTKRVDSANDAQDKQRIANGALKGTISRKDTKIAELQTEISRLQGRSRELANTLTENQAKANLKADAASLLVAPLGDETVALKLELATLRRDISIHRVVQSHIEFFGPSSPDQAAHDWDMGEIFVSGERTLKVPDLSLWDWTYKGARRLDALGEADPPIAMLAYHQENNEPVTLTIGIDSSGKRELSEQVQSGFNVLDWRDEDYAFFLVGRNVLELNTIASTLQNRDDDEVSAVVQVDTPTKVRSMGAPFPRPDR